jgi:16S rRNA (guanine966-N2)-methyltransferase
VPQGRSRGGTGTRPTTDRVRESLFNVLEARVDLDGAHVLDLYAGSGALGLEALSRGAASVLFVESDRRAADVIAANARALGANGVDIRCATVASVVTAPSGRAADVVFADPPYEVPVADVEAMLVALRANGWLSAAAVAVVERSTAGPAVTWPPGWEAWRERKYGDTRVEMAELLASGA